MMTKLTIAERIVLHLSRYGTQCDDGYNIPWDLTQDGIAASLRITRAHSSIELKKLRENGKVDERQGHIKGGKVRRKSYTLTPAGLEEAKHLKEVAKDEGIDIMPMIDMKRCDPDTIWKSVDEEDRDALGLACVLRCPVPRADIPETAKQVIPTDVNGMIILSDQVKKNILSVADDERLRSWNSAAADYWLDRDDVQERLYHLVSAGRIRDACRLVVNEKEKLLYNINDDLFDILAGFEDIPEKYVLDVLPVRITVAIESGDLDASAAMIDALKEMDGELGLLYSADAEMKKGDHTKALSIIRSVGITNRFEVDLRAAGAIGHLGNKKEALDLLNSMKEAVVKTGTVNGLDRIYIQMADVAAVSGDHDSSINYLTKALGVTGDEGKRKIYALLARSYGAAGMADKAKECASKSRDLRP
ncbi:MAG: hypothetical protein FWD92_02610 [Methanomassiliicoccaceae archaeon]|nr:hypothetical protein [Methanomassiliicoccaceae archaeon]